MLKRENGYLFFPCSDILGLLPSPLRKGGVLSLHYNTIRTIHPVRPCSSAARPPHRATGASPPQDVTTNASREALVMQGRDLAPLSLTRSQDNVDE